MKICYEDKWGKFLENNGKKIKNKFEEIRRRKEE